jgi:hypothetical protein
LTPTRIAIPTDAWHPQVNGVVTTLERTAAELGALCFEVLVPEGPAQAAFGIASQASQLVGTIDVATTRGSAVSFGVHESVAVL